MSDFCVYFIYLSTGHFYIGSTGQFDKRINSHFNQLRSGTHYNLNLQKARNESTGDFLVSSIPVSSRDEAYQLEEESINRAFNSPRKSFLTNISLSSKGGNGLLNHPRCEEIIHNRTDSLKKYMSSLSLEEKIATYGKPGIQNPMFGKKHSDETKSKISECKKGHSYNKGCKLSSEHVEKIRIRQRLRIGAKNSFYGKKHSDSTKAKLRSKLLGKLPINLRPITAGGLEFKSCADAARYFNISQGLVTYRIKSNKYPSWSYSLVTDGE
jgi:group I intron endonuclease